MSDFHRFSIAAGLTVLAALVFSACGSSSETVVVSQRPEPISGIERDTVATFVRPVPVAGLDTVALGDFPYGKMWLPDALPADYLESEYGIRPDSAWLGTVQRATLRLPNCTASFVSEDGLIVTNYHCVRSQVGEHWPAADSVLHRGYLADSAADSVRINGLYLDQLLGVTDITERVRARIDHLMDDDRREEVLRQTIERLERELTFEAKRQDTARHVQVVTLNRGEQFSAYRYRRLHDVRFVFIPEQTIGRFGGDTQNFTYPRYSFDVAFLRALGPDGEPVSSPAYFKWSTDGVSDGDTVFTAGNPGSTQRLKTYSQLEFERDFELPTQLAVLGARAVALQQYIAENPLEADSFDVASQLQSIRNVQKDARGRLEALNDDLFMRRILAREHQLDRAMEGRDSLQQVYRSALRSIEATQRTRRATFSQFAPFAMFGSDLIDSHVLIRAVYAYLYDFTRQRGVPENFTREYLNSGRAVRSLPLELEAALLAARIRELQNHLGEADPNLRPILRGSTPERAARRIIDATAMVDSVGFDSLAAAGFLSSGDPTVALAEAVVPLYLAVAQPNESLSSREDRQLARIALARNAVLNRVPPDGSFSLRISDGVVSGYTQYGTTAPPYTTFLGMYDMHFGFQGEGDFRLPDRWADPPVSLDLETPMNFVSTVDLTGGSSGSPVFTFDLDLVGIAFDSNVQALRNAYLFTEEAGRGIAVDTRGITEALRVLYEAEDLISELSEGRLATAPVP